MSTPVVFPSEGSERLPRPQASSALFAALAANSERFSQPLHRRLSSAAYDSASSGLPSPTWPTPPHTPSKLLADPKPLLLPPPLAASPIRASPRAHPRRLSNASARFSRRVSLASAYSLSRPPSSARLQSRQVSVRLATASARNSTVGSVPEDILGEGDVVGGGAYLNGELLTAIEHIGAFVPDGPRDGSQARFEIVKKLGSGSYATVFLAREILAEPAPPNDTDLPFEWNGSDDAHADPDQTIRTPGPSPTSTGRTYGRNFAIKCLSRASLNTPESLAVQMLEATLHGSLPVHPNVVSLHAAFESPSCLFLVLEYVRGPDLFYFLEQSRDALPPSPLVEEHEFTPRAPSNVPEPTNSGHHTHTASHAARTPPTPSLLSALGPSFLLSPTRLRLIASMFRQMCDAVSACHAHGVSHRDIKPENFIVTDAWVPTGQPDGRKQRKVVVKLSDFGLATDDAESSDMDCGSAPYMSYECRNNCAPTYNPRAADVWSLGIVLINMLYHVNPWADTFDGACPSFAAYRMNPVEFFITRFAGMTHAVAHFLATRVFCIPDSNRIDAAGFGEWVKSLAGHFDVGAMGEFEGSMPVTPVMGAVVLGGLPVQREGLIDVEGAREALENGLGLTGVDGEIEEIEEEKGEGEVLRTTTSGARKRGKRGARKNKNTAPPTEPTIQIPAIMGDDPAARVQDLARELSKQSQPSRTPSLNPEPRLTKKPSKWRLFSVRNESSSGSGRASGLDSVKDSAPEATSTPTVMSLLGSLEAAGPLAPRSSAPTVAPRPYVHPHTSHKSSPLAPVSAENRGRAKVATPGDKWGSSPIGQFGADVRGKSPATSLRNPTAPAYAASALGSSPAPVSVPAQTPAPAPVRVYERASAVESANWRQSTSTVSTTFTQFSNASARTVSTVATSVSGSSFASSKHDAASVRSAGGAPKRRVHQSNVKREFGFDAWLIKQLNLRFDTEMDGVPWELDGLPRQAFPRGPDGRLIQGHIHGTPRTKAPRAGAAALGTISEQPSGVYRRSDAAGSSTGLDRQRSASPEVPKKVQKGQINALKGMLRAWGGAKD
ncbi:kinase domain protein [Ceratobasidium sp. AG-Ba]|nr:kinase domain protein [Ceratobasidium sp. AG-Ba]